jgi:hypothetical protein
LYTPFQLGVVPLDSTHHLPRSPPKLHNTSLSLRLLFSRLFLVSSCTIQRAGSSKTIKRLLRRCVHVKPQHNFSSHTSIAFKCSVILDGSNKIPTRRSLVELNTPLSWKSMSHDEARLFTFNSLFTKPAFYGCLNGNFPFITLYGIFRHLNQTETCPRASNVHVLPKVYVGALCAVT